MTLAEQELQGEYSRILAEQTVRWDGRNVPLRALQPVYEEQDRRRRERAWRLETERWLADRGRIQELWEKLLAVRRQQAAGAGFADHVAIRRQDARLNPPPADVLRLHLAIEEWVTPAIVWLHEERRLQLGAKTLRPWDLPAKPSVPPLPSSSDPEMALMLWADTAMIDAFECWSYGNPTEATDPIGCGAQWRSQWLRFLPAVDWSGLEEALAAEWQRRAHLFLYPFGAIEHGLVQLREIAGTSPDAAFDEHALREAVDVILESVR